MRLRIHRDECHLATGLLLGEYLCSIRGAQDEEILRDFIAENTMFKFTVVDNPSEEMWILQGQLVGEFASELSASWQASQDRCPERSRAVDLSDVTSIDKMGEEVLLKMIYQRARFVVTGLYTKHLVEELQTRTQGEQQTD